ncbi:hypothetical protein BX666DRAFT_1926158 [Dichotomocladium elegans]|nr:hypothetical protein BX666DRAFT_1926158 [Dichotomocladium elegans]
MPAASKRNSDFFHASPMSNKAIDVDVDYYELLGLKFDATDKDIKKAYRLKAREVHPDKNPSPDAAALFHKLTQALDVLVDQQARAAYDRLMKAKMERLKKQNEMDSKRRAAKDELEERENRAKKAKKEQDQAEAQYRAELARLREEGAKRREEWREEPKQEKIPEPTELDCTLKLKWIRKKYNFSEADLETIISPIGKVDSIAISGKEKKKASALIVFKSVVDAHAVLTSKDTHPSLKPFETIDWVTGNEPAMVTRMNEDRKRRQEALRMMAELTDSSTTPTGKPLFASGTKQSSFFKNIKMPASKAAFSNAPALSDKEYEAITLMKLRQAERDHRIQQLNREDNSGK